MSALTCLTCSLPLADTSLQRAHYTSDLHRYNAKRRIAGLPAIPQDIFDAKVQQRLASERMAAEQPAQTSFPCKACKKTFGSEPTYSAHLATKKHKDNAKAAAAKSTKAPTKKASQSDEPSSSIPLIPLGQKVGVESTGDPDLDRVVARRLESAPPLPPTWCLFCWHQAATPEDNVDHMLHKHSFVIPDKEYLVDLKGLLGRLGEQVATWNQCLYCGRGFGGNVDDDEKEVSASSDPDAPRVLQSKRIEALRSHMVDKGHCRVPYESDEDRLQIADFYDFRPSYPDYAERKAAREQRRALKDAQGNAITNDDDAWEDTDDEDAQGGSDVLYEYGTDASGSESDSDVDIDELQFNSALSFGNNPYEITLPSGRKMGHRLVHAPTNGVMSSSASAARQHVASQGLIQQAKEAPKPRARLSTYYNDSLVPVGPRARPGEEQQVMRARNKGEAKNAMRQLRNFDAQKAATRAQMRVNMKNNNQKHFRDQLLQ